MSRTPVVIAIDGPSGVGKGTVGRAVARRLGYQYVDTGAMYRAVAWAARRAGLALDDEPAVARLAARASIQATDTQVVIDGHDVTGEIRTPETDLDAATVARLPEVRRVMVARQRQLGALGRLVMEGRDIGTAVFPDATVKIYLDADASERARRRARDPGHRARSADDVAGVASALEARDRADATRRVSPLVRASDATLIDTTGIPVEEVVSRVMAIVQAALAS